MRPCQIEYPGGADASLGIVERRFNQLPEPVSSSHRVVVQEHNQFAVRLPDRQIVASTESYIPFQANQSHPGKVVLNETNGTILGAIVDHPGFKVAKRLCAERSQAVPEKMATVVIHDYDIGARTAMILAFHHLRFRMSLVDPFTSALWTRGRLAKL